jgi:hypothetical protein
MKKRGQTTPFIIIAIIIIAVIGIFFVTNQQTSTKDQKTYPENIRPLISFVQNCIEETSNEAILETSKYSGYFNQPDLSIDIGIPIYYENQKTFIPSKNQIETEIGDYIDTLLFFCIQEFSDFPDINVIGSQPKTTASINSGSIELSVNYPLTISKDQITTNIEDFETTIPSRLNTIYNVASLLTEGQKSTPEGICVSCIYALSEANNLHINTLDYINNTVIFSIRDETTKINGENLVFNYANKY